MVLTDQGDYERMLEAKRRFVSCKKCGETISPGTANSDVNTIIDICEECQFDILIPKRVEAKRRSATLAKETSDRALKHRTRAYFVPHKVQRMWGWILTTIGKYVNKGDRNG